MEISAEQREKEYRKLFYFMKRWSKSPSNLTYTHGYTRGGADIQPAKRIYEFILELDGNKNISYVQKILDLLEFTASEYEKDNWNSFASGMKTEIRSQIKSIEKGNPSITKRL